MSNILITICARGGSKGVPKKNIKNLCGKPLIQYSIDTANQFIKKQSKEKLAKLTLSTDDIEIKHVAEKLGLSTNYQRPTELATDVAGKLDAIKHLLMYEEVLESTRFDYVIDLDVTAPLRTVSDLEEAFSDLERDNHAFNIFSVSPPHRNPYFNMVEINEEGYCQIVKPLNKTLLTRQSAPHVYDLNASFYIYKRDFFDVGLGVINNRSLAYEVKHLCFDIDNPLDFDIMELLISNRKLDFEL